MNKVFKRGNMKKGFLLYIILGMLCTQLVLSAVPEPPATPTSPDASTELPETPGVPEFNTILDCYNEDLTEIICDPSYALSFTEEFEDNLVSCTVSEGTFALGFEPVMYMFREYEILGVQNGFCVINFWFLENNRIDPPLLNKQMQCKFNDNERTLENVADAQDFCEGPLLDEINNLLEQQESIGTQDVNETAVESHSSSDDEPVQTVDPVRVIINPTKKKLFDKVETGTKNIEFNEEGIAFTKTAIDFNKELNEVAIEIQAVAEENLVDNKPTDVSKASSGKVYQYIRIEETNIASTDVEGALINFKVETSWITQESIDANEVVLSRYSNSDWTELPTVKTGADNAYIYYRAESPGLSYFAITVETEEQTVQEQASSDQTTEQVVEVENNTQELQQRIDELEQQISYMSQQQIVEETPKGIDTSTIVSAVLNLILLIAVIVLGFYALKKPAIKKPVSPQVIRLKIYIDNNLKKGYPYDQIKSQLISSGWPEKTIEEAKNLK